MPLIPINKNRTAQKRVLTLEGINFASDEASELASSYALIASDFRGAKPSGKGGFTVADVRKIAGEFAE